MTYITLKDFFFYIWLPIFFILLSITIFLILTYLKKKRMIRKLIINEKEELEKRRKIIKEALERTLNLYDLLISKGDYKKAVLESYNSLRNIINNHMEVKVEPFLTEKEAIAIYSKNSRYPLDSIYLIRLYQIYEKIRFGNKDLSNKEIEDYRKYLREITNRIIEHDYT